MLDSNTPIVLVVCNDYGELALAMYLLDGQSFAQNTTLMLPPRLHASNPDILPGRTLVYHSVDDIRKQTESLTPGILGLFSGYLLPIHRLCDSDELASLLRSTQAQGWKPFTSDPFVGLLDDLEPSELVTLKAPRWSIIWAIFAAREKKRLASLLTEMRTALTGMPHLYPIGQAPSEQDRSVGTRMHFHNPAFLSKPRKAESASADAPLVDPERQRWLFVLGDQDFTVQEGKYGQTIWAQDISKKFRKVLILKLHETLEAGRMPTLIAPAKVIESVRKNSPVADSMELLTHCDYYQFLSLLRDAEYVFYWNATSFSCILRTMLGMPWFTFDDGHLLRGMNADYGTRVAEWFYQGCEPPRLDMGTPMTVKTLRQSTSQYLKSAWQVQQGLLSTPDPQNLLSAIAAQRSAAPESDSPT